MIWLIALWLLFLNYRITHRKINYKGFSIICSLSGGKIVIGASLFSSSSSNMLGLYQRCIIVARYGGKIEIGEHCGISGSTIYAWNSIKIGNYTRVSANCKIIDNDFHPVELEYRHKWLNEEYTRRAPIEIGEDCFIGMNSIILKGTKLRISAMTTQAFRR